MYQTNGPKDVLWRSPKKDRYVIERHSITYHRQKTFCRVLPTEEIDLKLRKNQAAFRTGSSCREQIFTLRNITEQSLEHQLPKPLTAFIDHPYGTYCPYMKFHRSTQIYSKHWIQARAAVPKLKLEWQIFSPLCWVCNKVVFYHNSFFESILTLWCEKQ